MFKSVFGEKNLQGIAHESSDGAIAVHDQLVMFSGRPQIALRSVEYGERK